jgi:hypothetical protein
MRVLTVGRLRQIIKNIPDDTPVVLEQGAYSSPAARMEVACQACFIRVDGQEIDPEDAQVLNQDCVYIASGFLSSDERSKDPVLDRNRS